MMEIKLNYQGKELVIEDVKKLSSIGKFIGLMFSRRKRAKALLFEFKKPTRQAIHSFFVFFDFMAIWLDENNNVMEIRKVYPWTALVKPKKPFLSLVEIPLNNNYRKILRFLVEEKV